MFLWIYSNSFPLNLLLVRSHQAEIIIVKRFTQGRNDVTRVRVEPRSFDRGRRKNDAFTHSATLPTIFSVLPSSVSILAKFNLSFSPSSVTILAKWQHWSKRKILSNLNCNILKTARRRKFEFSEMLFRLSPRPQHYGQQWKTWHECPFKIWANYRKETRAFDVILRWLAYWKCIAVYKLNRSIIRAKFYCLYFGILNCVYTRREAKIGKLR